MRRVGPRRSSRFDGHHVHGRTRRALVRFGSRRGNRAILQEESRLTAKTVSRQEPNVQGGGWSRFGRERCRVGTRARLIVDHEPRISSRSTRRLCESCYALADLVQRLASGGVTYLQTSVAAASGRRQGLARERPRIAIVSKHDGLRFRIAQARLSDRVRHPVMIG